MYPPTPRCIVYETAEILRQNQDRQDLAHAVDQILPHEPGVIVFKQLAQSPMADRSNNHGLKCTVRPFATQVHSRRTLPIRYRRRGRATGAIRRNPSAGIRRIPAAARPIAQKRPRDEIAAGSYRIGCVFNCLLSDLPSFHLSGYHVASASITGSVQSGSFSLKRVAYDSTLIRPIGTDWVSRITMSTSRPSDVSSRKRRSMEYSRKSPRSRRDTSG